MGDKGDIGPVGPMGPKGERVIKRFFMIYKVTKEILIHKTRSYKSKIKKKLIILKVAHRWKM